MRVDRLPRDPDKRREKRDTPIQLVFVSLRLARIKAVTFFHTFTHEKTIENVSIVYLFIYFYVIQYA